MENKSKMLRSEMRAAILDFGTASKGIFLVILVTWHEVVHEHFYDMSKISQSMFTYLAFKSFCSVLSIFGEGNSRNELCTVKLYSVVPKEEIERNVSANQKLAIGWPSCILNRSEN